MLVDRVRSPQCEKPGKCQIPVGKKRGFPQFALSYPPICDVRIRGLPNLHYGYLVVLNEMLACLLVAISGLFGTVPRTSALPPKADIQTAKSGQ